MSQILKLSGKDFGKIMDSVLARGADFRFQAKGQSMRPFIRHDDVVTVTSLPEKYPGVGDIVVAFRDKTDSILVHRVIGKKSKHFILKGDNLGSSDGSFKEDQIIGIVVRVQRSGRDAFFGRGLPGKIIALLSGSGVLNRFIRPLYGCFVRLFPG